MTRTYRSKLREQQSEQTRQLILDAMAEAIAEQGPAEVSLQEVAERAGVSHRTIYRYFPTRQALVEAMGSYVDARVIELGGPKDPTTLDDLPEQIRRTFAAFDQIGAPAVAMVLTSQANRSRSTAHDERTRRWRKLLAAELAPLDADEQTRTFAIIRSLAHSSTWLTLRDEFGMSGEEAAAAVSWAIDALRADLAGRSPARPRGRRRSRSKA